MGGGGPNLRRGAKSASGYGPGGPNPGGVQIRCDTSMSAKKPATLSIEPPQYFSGNRGW